MVRAQARGEWREELDLGRRVAELDAVEYSREKFVVVSFDQDYRSNNLSNVMRKRQYWIKNDGRWRIFYEGGA
jgi:hypothetical protein